MSTFKLCLNASTIMTTDIMTQIDVAQTTGFVAIELWFDHIDDFVNSGKGSVDDIRQALNDNGLAVPTCIYLGIGLTRKERRIQKQWMKSNDDWQ